MPADTNPSGDIFGGWLMSQMDIAGGIVAMRRARGRVATVAVDAMTFIAPVAVGDEVSLYARVVGTGRTSVRVFIEAWKRNRYFEEMHQGDRRHVRVRGDRRGPPAGAAACAKLIATDAPASPRTPASAHIGVAPVTRRNPRLSSA